MKRALAERAKQSGLPNGVVTSSVLQVPPTNNTSVPLSSGDISPSQPLKVPRIDDNTRGTSNASSSLQPMPPASPKQLSIAVPTGGIGTRISSTTSTGTLLASPSPRSARGTKRPRGEGSPRRRASQSYELEEEDEETNQAKAFYLKHQNRALASELSATKYQLARLARERDHRRVQCAHACQSLHSLQATWTQMEMALPAGPDLNESSSPLSMRDENSRAPLSTGEGTSVELVGALLESLAALGERKPNKKSKQKNNKGAKKKKKKKNGNSSSNYAIVDSDDDDDDEEDGEASVSDDETSEDDSDSDSGWGMSSSNPPGESPMGDADQAQLDDLLRITDNVARRASALQQWIWGLLRRIESRSSSPTGNSGPAASSSSTIAKLTKRLARQKAKNKTLKATLREVSRARDEMILSDRRVRRGLYRLAAGRVQLQEIMKDIEIADEDKAAALAWMDGEAPAGAANDAAVIKSETPGAVLSSNNVAEGIDPTQLAAIQKKVLELEQVAESRAKQIQQLLADCESKEKRINELVLKEQEVSNKKNGEEMDHAELERKFKQSDMYAELSTKLASKTAEVEKMTGKMAELKQEWSQALGVAELAEKTMQELQSKHLKKWAELTSDVDLDDENPAQQESNLQAEFGENDVGNEKPSLRASAKSQAVQIITLQHKLTQALENVRQADASRKTLAEALAMTESLQAKLDEVRAKYAALQQSRQTSAPPESNNQPSGASTPKSKSAPPTPSGFDKAAAAAASSSAILPPPADHKSAERAEKLHRDYRRARKEVAALTASKEAAKAKLERLEKERDALIQTNVRLLKQTAEKDDMNAQSLSTILHLKQVTEQGAKERASLEQQVKSAQQLALSARLAANARDRLDEEYLKRQKELEQMRDTWEQKCEALTAERDALESKLTQQRNKMALLLKNSEVAKSRCDELASESTRLKEAKHKMMESLAVAKKEAVEAVHMSHEMAKRGGGIGGQSGGNSQFTVEDLSTQVTVLKSRLMCPVCNCRDKTCILSRCNHMFCKECIDENVKNRSRKCPACGQRFDTKDIGEVWL